jgi:HEAT repeat protein
MRTDADKAIPILKEIAFKGDNPGTASLAVFVLAQSDRSDARETVVQAAQSGPVPVRVAAVRELGRFGGTNAPTILLSVYTKADVPVKRQVLKSLGERSERSALMTIAQSEMDRELRTRAILTLGQAGGHLELRTLYTKFGVEFKRPIIQGLFNARAVDELILLAERERDETIRQDLHAQLRLLGTPKAKEYLQKVSGKK